MNNMYAFDLQLLFFTTVGNWFRRNIDDDLGF